MPASFLAALRIRRQVRNLETVVASNITHLVSVFYLSCINSNFLIDSQRNISCTTGSRVRYVNFQKWESMEAVNKLNSNNCSRINQSLGVFNFLILASSAFLLAFRFLSSIVSALPKGISIFARAGRAKNEGSLQPSGVRNRSRGSSANISCPCLKSFRFVSIMRRVGELFLSR